MDSNGNSIKYKTLKNIVPSLPKKTVGLPTPMPRAQSVQFMSTQRLSC